MRTPTLHGAEWALDPRLLRVLQKLAAMPPLPPETPEQRAQRLAQQAHEQQERERAAAAAEMRAAPPVVDPDTDVRLEVIDLLVQEGKARHVAADLTNTRPKLHAQARRLGVL